MNRDINEILQREEYKWIKEEPRLKDKIAFLTFGGSISYGLDTPESDIDIRGICMPSMEDLLGCGFLINPEEKKNTRLVFGKKGFEQVTDTPTDTTIYTLKKIISLLYKCNPNTIEMLGCKPEHYAYISSYGQKLLDNKELFLSKLAYGSFAGYARAQFQRLKNAIGKDSKSNVFQSINLADSINRMHGHLEREYPEYNRSMLNIYVTDSNGNDIKVNGTPVSVYDVGIMFNDIITEITSNGVPISDEDVQIRFSINFDKISNRAFLGIFNEVAGAVKEFNRHLGHRNHKKDDYHLNKHAMHLIRLYLMALDILNNHEIITYREKDHDFLMSIKTGEYFNRDTNTFNTKFFDIVTDFDTKILSAYENTTLPEYPDINKINNLVMEINQEYLSNISNSLIPNKSDHIFTAMYDTSKNATEDWYE